MINLPKWSLTLVPPLYDTSSKSPIEMTAQVYGKMREFVDEYNRFTEDIQKAITDFEVGIISSEEEFKKYITCTMQEYINSLDEKVTIVDRWFNDFDGEMNNIITEKMNEALANGNLTITETYDSETESLKFVIGGNVNE